MQTTGRWKIGLALAGLTAGMWGVLPVVLKSLLHVMDPYTLTWCRFLAATLVLGLYLFYRGRIPLIHRSGGRSWVFLAVAVFGLVGNYILYLLGLRYVNPETSQMVIQLAPMFLLLGSLLFFRESFQRIQWLGLAILMAGLLLFFNDHLGDFASHTGGYFFGVIITVVAAVAWAAYALAQKRLLSCFDSEQILVLLYAFATVLLLPTVQLSQLSRLSGLQWGLLLFACFNTLVAYGAFAEALAHWEASRVSAVLAVTPLFTLFSVWLVARSFPSVLQPQELNTLSLTGAFLVVAGSIAAGLGRRRKKMTPRPME
jgi:drug/metabolite transporter (DMT)-like permease